MYNDIIGYLNNWTNNTITWVNNNEINKILNEDWKLYAFK